MKRKCIKISVSSICHHMAILFRLLCVHKFRTSRTVGDEEYRWVLIWTQIRAGIINFLRMKRINSKVNKSLSDMWHCQCHIGDFDGFMSFFTVLPVWIRTDETLKKKIWLKILDSSKNWVIRHLLALHIFIVHTTVKRQQWRISRSHKSLKTDRCDTSQWDITMVRDS